MNKLQIYMAGSMMEYNTAIQWVKENGYDDQLKEVGEMQVTDALGLPLTMYVFLFVGPNESMIELSKVTNAGSPIPIG